jgi:hypothetical protein
MLGRNYSSYNIEMVVGFKYLRLFNNNKNSVYTYPQNFSLNYVPNQLTRIHALYSEAVYSRQLWSGTCKGDKQNDRSRLLV